ncbi:hypothetical protein [Sphingomonas sp. UYP23]
MVVSTVAFIPPFIFGLVFLLGPSLLVALLVGDTASAVAAALIAIAAFVWPRDNFYLSNVLCALRTIPAIYLIAVLVGMKIAHSGPPSIPLFIAGIVVAGCAQWRIRGLVRDGDLAI